MPIRVLGEMEAWARGLRDEWIVKPILRSRLIKRSAYLDIDIAVVNAGDHFIAFDPNDPVIGRQIRVARNWERAAFDAVAGVVKSRIDVRNKTFVDVGANIGTQTVYALLAGFGRAVSIEPVPANVRCLRLNVILNGYTERVAIVEQAAGATSGRLALSLDARNSGGHSFAIAKPADSAKMEVPVEPVDAVLQRNAVAPGDVGLLWLDVEGFEPQAIAGAAKLIEAGPPLMIEYTPAAYGPEAARSLIALLAARYREWGIAGKSTIALRPTSELSAETLPPGQIDLLFL